MSEVTKPIALDESFNTTGQTPKNLADVMKNGLQEIAQAIDSHQGGGGHVILDQNGNALDQEPNMQFVDAHTSDDSVNAKTIIENIKSVTEAQFESATEDGLYDVDVDGAEIGEISEEYVEVEADGVKTYATLLNELWTKIDSSKLSERSQLQIGTDVFVINGYTATQASFTICFPSSSSPYTIMEAIVIRSNSAYGRSTPSGYTDKSAGQPTNGTKLTLYYGTDKAVVDLQTTANRCLMSNGETVEDAVNAKGAKTWVNKGFTKSITQTEVTSFDTTKVSEVMLSLEDASHRVFGSTVMPIDIAINGQAHVMQYQNLATAYFYYSNNKPYAWVANSTSSDKYASIYVR